METKRWIMENRPDGFDVATFTPYPGSHIHDHPEEYDIQIHESYWNTEYFHKGIPGKYQVVVSTSGLSRDRISELRDEIETECRQALGLEGLV